MAEVVYGSLQWQRAATGSPDLVAPYLCDFTAASSFRFTPKGTLASTPGTATGAEGVVIDNMRNGVPVTVFIGPIQELVPAFQKVAMRVDPLAVPDIVLAASSGTTYVYFFTGAFHGNTTNVNTYAAYKAGVVSTNSDGTQDVYFNTLRWKTDSLLANNFNLDSLTDSGFYDVLNPTSPASGNLSAGTWLIEAHTYSSSPLYAVQTARNILSPNTLVYERRQLGGSGWTPWRPVGLLATGQCQFRYVDTTHCQLVPLYGGLLRVNGNLETVPAGGISFPNTIGATTLADNTLYYAYVYIDATGTMQPEFSTTAFAIDASGNAIKSGDATRALVGMVSTVTSGQFIDTPSYRYVATYFNRYARDIAINQNGGGTASTSPVAAIVGAVLSWGDHAVSASLTGYTTNGTNGALNLSSVGLSGNNGQFQAATINGGANVPVAATNTRRNAIGVVAVVAYVYVSAGTGTWYHTLYASAIQ